MSETATQEPAATTMASGMTAGTICHVEFHVPDVRKAQDFYSRLFGWQFMVTSEDGKETYFGTPGAGPCGCVYEGTPAGSSATVIYVTVDDIPAALAKAQGLGATTVKEKTEIPGGHGFLAHLRAPDGNVWGIWSMNG